MDATRGQGMMSGKGAGLRMMAAAAVTAAVLVLLPSCGSCGSGRPPMVERGVKYQRVTIGAYGSGDAIALSSKDARRLVGLLGDCRLVVPDVPPDTMVSWSMEYVVHLQPGAQPADQDPGVTFTADRVLLHACCIRDGTQREIRELLDPYMDRIDEASRRGRTPYTVQR
ncbi:hypothetical protein OKA04_11950 [Luteolibacter flavescens]|uniref:Lipoprotein n=1 Tax=Luteolibacter flavescens TaxID=1859460 RepID=A0ABT3FPF2_9BACT|nr:hypothetical protein [Luteolibacter flavescens]MCW1885444.1 hypothetical protein [Luteolibacter flavescens]